LLVVINSRIFSCLSDFVIIIFLSSAGQILYSFLCKI